MRLAVISDVHGNLVALDAVLADIRTRAPDVIVNLGDCVTGPFWPRETCEQLRSLAFPTVRGNHDRWLEEEPSPGAADIVQATRDALTAAQRTALASLPAHLDIAPDILAVHGTPTRDTEYLLEEKVDGRLALAASATLERRLGAVTSSLVLCGHSHTAHSAYAPGHRLIVNPGSVGCPRYADDVDWLHAEGGSPHARYAVITRRANSWNVELIALAYDWERVAQQARANGRPEWAEGFLGNAV